VCFKTLNAKVNKVKGLNMMLRNFITIVLHTYSILATTS